MKSKLIYLVILFSITTTTYARKPKWIKERPILTDYYQGIGITSKAESPNSYSQSARSKALKELSSEIKVTISANSLLQQFENNNDVRETFESSTSLKSSEILEGYEIETYEDSERYWVYLKLSKQKYQQEKDSRLYKAKKFALINYRKGVELIKNNDASGALTNFLKVIAQLKDHIEEDLVVKDIDGDINLGADTYSQIQILLQKIKLDPNNANISLQFYRDLHVPISLTASYQSNSNGKTPIFNLPICFKFIKGDGEITPVATTNDEGVANCSITRLISHSKRQQIQAQLNIATLLDADPIVAKIQQAFLPMEALPQATFNIELKRAKAFIVLEEHKLYSKSNGSLLANKIRNDLNQNFFTFTDSIEEADFTIKIKVNFIEGDSKPSNGYTVYIAYGDVAITIFSLKSKEEIFSDEISEIKGMRSGSIEHAIKDAAGKCFEAYTKNILPKLEQLEM